MRERKRGRGTYASPSAVANEANHIENTSTLSQKYVLATVVSPPMYDLLQYGSISLACERNVGCHRPRMIRGASLVSQSG